MVEYSYKTQAITGFIPHPLIMRIAFIHPRFPSAQGTGATYSATQIVKGLADEGHEVCVYCTQPPPENWKSEKLNTKYLSGSSIHPHTDMALNKGIRSRLDELREYDIVHSYLMPLIPSIAEVGKASNVGTVVTLNAYKGVCAKNDLLYRDQEKCRSKSVSKCLNCIAQSGFQNDDNGYLYQTVSQLLSLRLIRSGEDHLTHIDGFHALSPHLKKTYTDFGFPGDKIEVIPNILDPKFDIEHRTNFEEPFNLLYIGYLKHSKGVDGIIDIFSQVLEKSSKDVTLTIVGDGELADYLQSEIERQNLSEVVDLRGRLPNRDLPEVYANHDLFIYPSRWDEPFGRVFLEAMAAGTPIVSTNVGSVQEIIGGGGICTEQSNQAFTNAILSIIEDDLLSEYSKAGKRRIQQYREPKVIPQFEMLYANAQSQSH